MRNFVAQLRSLVETADGELGPENAHVRYLRETTATGRLAEGLRAVVAAYRQESEAKTNRLESLAFWSLGSTGVVLAISGWLVFWPMVHRVKADMDALGELNATLEQRVAERTALAEQRAEALLQSERLAAIGQMVAGVAHESRNALQQIQACCGMLQWGLHADGKTRDLLDDVQKAQERLRRLFDDLRGYAAPLKLEPSRRDVREILSEAWASLEHERDGRKASLRQETLTADAHCVVDPLGLEQVFRNILENTLAACTDPVVIETCITDAIVDDRQAVEIAIRDNGPGLSDEQRERIFQPFYSTKSRGSGLGMAISQRIVEAHGGRIAVGPASGPGTVVVITIPRGGP